MGFISLYNRTKAALHVDDVEKEDSEKEKAECKENSELKGFTQVSL